MREIRRRRELMSEEEEIRSFLPVETNEGNTFERIYQIVCRIPRGKVATYGQIARMAGNKRWSRVVGYALHVNPKPGVIPCHRVVNRLGEASRAFAFGGENEQIRLLESEGVRFQKNGRVDLQKYLWKGEEDVKKS
jgi:methylated-DNA-protein-cysteine methyltransferase-like protein